MKDGYIARIKSLHLDILKEIGNIGAGNAATALSALLGSKIEMKVPSVRIVSFDEMMDMAGGAEKVVASVYLRIEGEAPGNMFFILPVEYAVSFIRHMTGNHSFSFSQLSMDELSASAFQELGNILAGSYLSALCDFTKMDLYPSVPSLRIDMFGAIISFGLIEISHESDYAIVIDTALKDSSLPDDVKGHFFLLPDPDSFNSFFESLGVGIRD